MTQVTIHEAKTQLSRLLNRVFAGEEVVIAKGKTPIARLVPWKDPVAPRVPGLDRGLIELPEDFDAPLSPELLEEFGA